MLKLMLRLTMGCLILLTLGGCLHHQPSEPPKLAFCDAEESRRFSQAEVDWRTVHAPANFRRDLKTNKTGARECGWFQDL